MTPLPHRFPALMVSRDADKRQSVGFHDLAPDDLMPGNVVVRPLASTVNYKDGLAITGKLPVVRRWPMIPGIDLSGEVLASEDPRWRVGDRVLLNGWGVGETHYGGYAGLARLNGDWLIRHPERFEPYEAMALGTAGYTAMLAVAALESHGVGPAGGTVLVTGATGGVGSVAVMLLAKLGFHVAAATGKAAEADYLHGLGAREIVPRDELSGEPKLLDRERWAGAIDTVGSRVLANVLAGIRGGGAVAACGNAAGMDLVTSVAPLILRGVSLLGIDSVYQPIAVRETAWTRLGDLVDRERLAGMTETIGLADVPEAAARIVEGRVRGRIVVSLG